MINLLFHYYVISLIVFYAVFSIVFKVALDNIRTNGKLQSILPYLVTFLASQVKHYFVYYCSYFRIGYLCNQNEISFIQ